MNTPRFTQSLSTCRLLKPCSQMQSMFRVMSGPIAGSCRSFYHFHGDPRQVVRVPSPMSVARLKKMDYKINGMMEMRDITAAERIKHFNLRKTRAEIMRDAGHKVQEVDYPPMTIAEMLAWTEFPRLVKKELLKQLYDSGFFRTDEPQCYFNEKSITLLLEEHAVLQQILNHHLLSPHAEKIIAWLKSISIGLPDWMYFANTEGLCLGESPVLDDRPIRLIWKARFVERQAETAAAVKQAIELGEVPLIYLQGSDEGRADWGETNKKGVWIGFHSSRTDPGLYNKVLRCMTALECPQRPSKIVEVTVREEIDGIPNLRHTFYHKDLTALFVPGTSAERNDTVALITDCVTPESLVRLKEAEVDVTPIPLEEGLMQGLNSVLLWGQSHGGAPGTKSVALMPPGCPTLQKCVESRGWQVAPLEFGSPAGGGNWECETNYALDGFPALKPTEQDMYARFGNRVLERFNLDKEFKFISSSDLQGMDWILDMHLDK
eukprot:gnl/MRDRNA2_/MRDRNA2_27678_c0_seq1.p1 gnl/MRDRNA2_/MRDRNA2_27678_c0~~gnl/MRDRNA2_/MRDRNA2_27678_c0_seq1.p1  ORF type:complete len:491 (-),score=75.21 gnl/MRDRNA2_/MRDRNA2_27678_c0_seq1:171-1643(-)